MDFLDYTITVTDDVEGEWFVGDVLAIASTDFDYEQAERYQLQIISSLLSNFYLYY